MNNRQDRRRIKKRKNGSYQRLIKKVKKMISDGVYDEAELVCQDAVLMDDTRPETYHMMALIAFETGRLKDAGNQILEAALRAGEDATIHADCGAIMNLLGRSVEAEAACRQAITLAPNHIEAYNNLSVALSQQNRHAEAIEVCDVAIKKRPDYADALINKGNFLINLEDPVGAKKVFAIAIEKAPENPLARVNLGTALRLVGDLHSAEVQCKKALALRPDYPEAYFGLGMILINRDQYVEAQAAFDKALKFRPDFEKARINLAAAKFKSGDITAAEEEYCKVITAHPKFASAWTGLGIVLLAKGDLVAACRAFESAVKLDSSEGEAWINLVSAPQRKISTADIKKMEKLVGDTCLKNNQRIAILFALGEASAKTGNYNEAFNFFQCANEARRRTMEKKDITFDPSAMKELAEAIIDEFSITYPDKKNTCTSNRPVFVVGVPRSGTTLVEQILASHPEVESLGEARIISSLISNFPKGVRDLCIEEIIAKALARFGSSARRVVDKTPFQFMHIGLIRRIFPRAFIIVCQRNRIDVGLSCYFQNFVTDYPWSTDLKNIGIFIKFYDRLISHWQSKYENIHVLCYEALIANPEEESRRLLKYIGLQWDKDCLSFHKNKNPVFTASNWQVRQPIYHTSVDRSRFYKSQLKALYAGLSSE